MKKMIRLRTIDDTLSYLYGRKSVQESEDENTQIEALEIEYRELINADSEN